MARFSVHPLVARKGLVLSVQSDLLENLPSRMVIPLVPVAEAHKPFQKLNPVFELDGEKVVLYTEQLTAIDRNKLKPAIGSLQEHHQEIVQAIDFLMEGI
jgi:toxin CcdB